MPRKPTELLPGTLDLLILKAISLQRQHGYGVLLRIRQIAKLSASASASGRWFSPSQISNSPRPTALSIFLHVRSGKPCRFMWQSSPLVDGLRSRRTPGGSRSVAILQKTGGYPETSG